MFIYLLGFLDRTNIASTLILSLVDWTYEYSGER